MDKQELLGRLKDLHSELQRLESLNDNERATLETLASDIREILEKEPEETHNYRGLGDRLKAAVAELEASHPRVTMSMREIIDQIAFMGI